MKIYATIKLLLTFLLFTFRSNANDAIPSSSQRTMIHEHVQLSFLDVIFRNFITILSLCITYHYKNHKIDHEMSTQFD